MSFEMLASCRETSTTTCGLEPAVGLGAGLADALGNGDGPLGNAEKPAEPPLDPHAARKTANAEKTSPILRTIMTPPLT